MNEVTASEPFELKLSFKRDAGEHYDAMAAAARRFYSRQASDNGFSYMVAVIVGAALIGVTMELHRRFVLPYFFGDTLFPDLSTAVAYFSPLIALVFAFQIALAFYRRRKQRAAMAGRMDADVTVDVDITQSGIKFTGDDTTVFLAWAAIRDISLTDHRMDLDTATFVVYLPERAFADRAAFLEADKKIRSLWRHAAGQSFPPHAV